MLKVQLFYAALRLLAKAVLLPVLLYYQHLSSSFLPQKQIFLSDQLAQMMCWIWVSDLRPNQNPSVIIHIAILEQFQDDTDQLIRLINQIFWLYTRMSLKKILSLEKH